MASFNDVAQELARQKVRLERIKDPLEARSELANSVYPLMAMANEATSETIIALSDAIEQRVSQMEAALEELAEALDDDDDGDDGGVFEEQFIRRCLWAVDELLARMPKGDADRARALELHAELKQMTDDDDVGDGEVADVDVAKSEEEGGNADS